MPEQRVFVISGMAPRQVTPRDGRPSFTIWEVQDDQGTTWRVREDLYNQALAWYGQRVIATTRVEQRGNFTNYYADSIAPAGATGPVQQAQAAQPQPQPLAPPLPTPPTVSEWERQKQQSIHRQTAAKVAAKMSATATEFWENVLLITNWFETGTVPAPPQPKQNAGAYQQYDPGPQPDQYTTVGDEIPF